jgi:PTH1 family peptidyl-tRNA hydrolase
VVLVAALGNPGPEYSRHRHNIGFMVGEELRRRWGWGPLRSRFQGLAGEGPVDGEKVLLLLPMTFMNDSGRGVGEAARFGRVPPERVLVIHDESEIPFGDVRLKEGGGLGGHNGLRSIERALGSREFWRVRAGVGRPTSPRLSLADYLLRPFDEDPEEIRLLIDKAADRAEEWIRGGGGEPDR